MNDALGLREIRVTGIAETGRTVVHQAEHVGEARCPDCGATDRIRPHTGWQDVTIRDTPTRGKHSLIEIQSRRYRCGGCGATFTSLGPDMLPGKRMTRRLHRHIERVSPTEPSTKIARSVGVSQRSVYNIALHFSMRLYERHRFPTPKVLGIDDLKIHRKTYTVLTNGETGQAVAIIDSGAADNVAKEIAKTIDASAVQYLVSDLGNTNLTLADSHFSHAIHVADKWHVLRGAQTVLSKIISQDLNQLRKDVTAREKKLLSGSPVDLAELASSDARRPRKRKKRHKRSIDPTETALLAVKKELMGQRLPAMTRAEYAAELMLPHVTSALKPFPRVRRAFWARVLLHRAYASADRAEAFQWLRLFLERADHHTIRAEMADLLGRLYQHRRHIANWFRFSSPNREGKRVGWTTSRPERRNRTIRAAVRASNAIDSIHYLRLRAVYEPFELDGHLIECSQPECGRIEGPDWRIMHTKERLDLVDSTKSLCSQCQSSIVVK